MAGREVVPVAATSWSSRLGDEDWIRAHARGTSLRRCEHVHSCTHDPQPPLMAGQPLSFLATKIIPQENPTPGPTLGHAEVRPTMQRRSTQVPKCVSLSHTKHRHAHTHTHTPTRLTFDFPLQSTSSAPSDSPQPGRAPRRAAACRAPGARRPALPAPARPVRRPEPEGLADPRRRARTGAGARVPERSLAHRWLRRGDWPRGAPAPRHISPRHPPRYVTAASLRPPGRRRTGLSRGESAGGCGQSSQAPGA